MSKSKTNYLNLPDCCKALLKTDDEIKKARKVTQLILTHFYKPVSANYNIYSKNIFSVSLLPQYHANNKKVYFIIKEIS